MISTKINLNSLKYSDYSDPILPHKSDYRTSNVRAHRYKQSLERNFVPQQTHQLCSELKAPHHDYRPKSETSNQFAWKINTHRNHREDLAISSSSAHYNHQFTDKVKVSAPIAPLNFYRSRHTDASPFNVLLREPMVRERDCEPAIEILDKTSHYTHTPGYFPMSDQLVSLTQLDYHQHRNYATARTNLIVRREKPFNADSTFFAARSKLINSYPMRGQRYSNELTRDKSKFSQSNYDRIIPQRSAFVSNFGLTTEMSSNY